MSEAAESSCLRDLLRDLDIVSELASMRLQLRGPETHRAARVREVIDATTNLANGLADHAQRASAIKETGGTTEGLVAATIALHASLARYASMIQEVASEFGPLVSGAADSPFRFVSETPFSSR